MISKRAPQWKRYWNLWRHVESPGTYLRRKLGFGSKEPAQFVFRGGLKVRVPVPRLVEFKEIMMDDAYLRGFRPAALGQGQGTQMAVIDVGANLGFFSLYAKTMFPQCVVIGLEPLSGNFAFFRANLALNPQLGGSVAAVNAALASARGTLKLCSQRGGEFPTDATLWTQGVQGTLFEVPALTLGDLLSEYRIARIALLKMDCEGAEFDILYHAEPAVLERIDAIAMEVHKGKGDGQNIEGLGQFLCHQGFACSLSSRGDFLWAARDPSWLVCQDLPIQSLNRDPAVCV
jgi:FkbM family methyltransferase